MKKISLFIPVLLFFHCNECRVHTNRNRLNLYQDTLSATTINNDPYNSLIILSDSLKYYHDNNNPPSFLYNPYLDYDFPFITDHKSLSIRKILIDSISDKNYILLIMRDKSKLEIIADSSKMAFPALLNIIPYKGVSTYKMLEDRVHFLDSVNNK